MYLQDHPAGDKEVAGEGGKGGRARGKMKTSDWHQAKPHKSKQSIKQQGKGWQTIQTIARQNKANKSNDNESTIETRDTTYIKASKSNQPGNQPTTDCINHSIIMPREPEANCYSDTACMHIDNRAIDYIDDV